MISVSRIAKLFIFFTIFYTVLAGYTALLFKVFFTTIDDRAPKWQLDQSLIGSTPGLTYRPVADDDLIEYRAGDADFVEKWVELLNNFLAPYLSTERSENVEGCYFGQDPLEGKVCDFKIPSGFAPCIPQFNYGFDFDGSDKGPCVFFKLNKVFGWVPVFYDSNTVYEEMPVELVEKIRRAEMMNTHRQIWLDCSGRDASDVENLGPITYYPDRGFSGNYFPYLNVDGYLSPLVAVHFEKPKHGVLIKIECKAWAANIQHNLQNNHGIVRFSLFIH